MAFEKGRYYTISQKIAGKVVRFYFGCSENVRQIVAENEQIRIKKQQIRVENQRFCEELAKIDHILDTFHRLAEALAHAARTEAGYHQHRGQWRKCRVFRPKPIESPPA